MMHLSGKGNQTKIKKQKKTRKKGVRTSYPLKMGKKGQIELTFNWIYIAIAGAVILLFFFSIIVKQKQVSEERLSGEVVRIMGSVFAGAGVSEKTKNFIPTGALADYTFYFSCEDGVSEFGLKDQPSRIQDSVSPIFSPREIKTTEIILWSLPYRFPFKVIDFLMVTSLNNKYYILGKGDFVNEFINSTDRFNRDYIQNVGEIEADKSLDVRIIDVDGNIVPGNPIPARLQDFPDERVSAVVFSGSNQVDFYRKEGVVWKKTNLNPIRIISLSGERDAAKYAAVFADDDKIYQCNMQKAFRRLEILSEVYGGQDIDLLQTGGKLAEMEDYYASLGTFGHPDCLGNIRNYQQGNLRDSLAALKNRAAACQLEEETCVDLITTASDIRKLNNGLRANCITLY